MVSDTLFRAIELFGKNSVLSLRWSCCKFSDVVISSSYLSSNSQHLQPVCQHSYTPSIIHHLQPGASICDEDWGRANSISRYFPYYHPLSFPYPSPPLRSRVPKCRDLGSEPAENQILCIL